MTSLSIRQFVLGIYKQLGLRERDITKVQTGGPDGDLGSNEILLSSDKTVAVIDGSGVLADPVGIDREELVRLAKARKMVVNFDVSKLSKDGYLVKIEDQDVRLPCKFLLPPPHQSRTDIHDHSGRGRRRRHRLPEHGAPAVQGGPARPVRRAPRGGQHLERRRARRRGGQAALQVRRRGREPVPHAAGAPVPREAQGRALQGLEREQGCVRRPLSTLVRLLSSEDGRRRDELLARSPRRPRTLDRRIRRPHDLQGRRALPLLPSLRARHPAKDHRKRGRRVRVHLARARAPRRRQAAHAHLGRALGHAERAPGGARAVGPV